MPHASHEQKARETAPYTEPEEAQFTAEPSETEWCEPLPARAVELSQNAAQTLLTRASELHQSALSELARRRSLAADTLERLSRALAFVGSEVQGQDAPMARQIEATRARIEKAAHYIESASPEAVSEDVARLVRSRPTTVACASFVAGVLLGRFLKASQKERFQA